MASFLFRPEPPPAFSLVRTALISGLLMALFTAISTWVHPVYGWYLFLALPLVLGAGVSAYATKGHEVSIGKILATTALANGVACLALLLLAVEGLICLVMALPISTVGMLVGVFLGRFAVQRGNAAFGSRVTIVVLPVILALVDGSNHEPIVRSVHSSVEIPAPPHVVWHFPCNECPKQCVNCRRGIFTPNICMDTLLRTMAPLVSIVFPTKQRD